MISKPNDGAPSPARPTPDQEEALDAMLAFAAGPPGAFILSGAAGTGKTTLMRAFVEALEAVGRPVRLVAPTGRAARVLRDRTGKSTSTLHSHLYTHSETRLGRKALTLRFVLRHNDDPPRTVYVVDEASMVADRGGAARSHLEFGSGRLLRDLVAFSGVASGSSDRHVVFVGDPAQLPPVGEPFSPALNAGHVRTTYGVPVAETALTEVLRQRSGGGILARAAGLRDAILRNDFDMLDLAPDGREITPTDHERIVPRFLDAAEDHGSDGAVIITRTNRAATGLNLRIRAARWHSPPALVPGDRLIVVQNNPLYQLYNGDFVEVVAVADEMRLRRPMRNVTLVFREVTFRDLASEREIRSLLIENVLASGTANLAPDEQQALIVDFQQRHRGERPGSDAFDEALRSDPYLNAVRGRYGYAVTCHKAQGGEWPVVFVVFDRSWRYHTESDYRWIYTAITRARSHLVTLDGPNGYGV